MHAVLTQLHYELKRFQVQKGSIQTLFIGGGTPSTIEPVLYKSFFKTISPYLKKGAEITSEANPNSATKTWLQGMYDLGVNRVSFGVQSFNQKKLKLLGRNHTALMAKKAVTQAKDIGFNHISIDLIYGTSLDSKVLLSHDLDIAFSLPIDHLSIYSLTIEENTLFHATPQVQNDDEDIALWLQNEIQNRGFKQYEISNFGTSFSKHNLGYWQYKDYIGIGSGAVGFFKDHRIYPVQEINTYVENPLQHNIENLSKEDIKKEKILLGLRCMIGFSKDILNTQELNSAQLLTAEGKLFYQNGRFFNTNYLLSDEIALFLLE